MIVTNDKRREVATKVREMMDVLGQIELDGTLLADVIEPSEADECSTPNRFEELTAEIHEAYETLADALDRRLMPEGMEWPRFEDGKPVRPGDRLLDKDGDWFKAVSFVFTCDWWSVGGYQGEGFCELSSKTRRELSGMAYGERVKRPAPKVLDADGVEIHVGDTVWNSRTGDRLEVVEAGRSVFVSKDGGDPFPILNPGEHITHRAPVLAADGKPLREGETVWHEDGTELRVFWFGHEEDGETLVRVKRVSGPTDWAECRNLSLTHERSDSWERLGEDAGKSPCEYFEQGHGCGSCPHHPTGCQTDKARDLVRRARALAGDA